MTVTKAILKQSLRVLQDLRPSAGYVLDWAYGQPRLGCQNGSRNISARDTKRRVHADIWLIILTIRMEEDRQPTQ